MNKILIAMLALTLLLTPITVTDERDIRLEELNEPLHSSANFEFIEVAQSSINLLNQGNFAFTDRFVLTDSVMDSSGATYVTGNLKEYSILFGDITVNFNDMRSQDPPKETPIVAKLSVSGDWEWVLAPEPKPGSECNPEDSVMTEEHASGVVNAISLSKSETDIAVVGSFFGCYQFGTENLYNNGLADDGFIALIDSETGDASWSAIIDADGFVSSPGVVKLEAVVFSDNGENIFVGGSLVNVVVNATYSGGENLSGDYEGDAYISAHSAETGLQLAHRDSCSSNDLDSGNYLDCNGAGAEKIATLDILYGDIVAGIDVTANGVSDISVFDSSATNHGSGSSTALAWMFDESTSLESSISESPITFGLDHTQDHYIEESYFTGEDVILATNGKTEEDLALGSVNSDSAITFEGHPSTDWIIPLGFVTVRNSDDFFVFTSKGPANYNIYDSGVLLNNMSTQLGEIIFVAMDKQYSNFMKFDGLVPWVQQTTIASNGDYASIFGLNTKHDGIVLTPDSDLDGIPNMFDINMHIPASSDPDDDGIITDEDNCPYIWNVNQLDSDSDLIGDACDDDIDGDEIINSNDDCPFIYVDLHNDSDENGCRDPDNDLDDDGILNENDQCPGYDDGTDDDNDGFIDGCDDFPNDTDNDGVTNDVDNCILIYNPNQANMGGDTNQGDACDSDIDGDGITNIAPIHVASGSSQDLCPYVNAAGQDENQDGCIDDVECPACAGNNSPGNNNNLENITDEGDNESSALIDPDDVETVVVVAGTGAVGGGALALVLSKLRGASRFIGIDDGLEALQHLPKRKKEDAGSDHYFQRGLVRQREMTLSADKNLDDYIEDNEKEGVEKK